MEALGGLLTGFSVILTPENLYLCFLGSVIGTLVGVLPGVGPLAALIVMGAGVALLLWSPSLLPEVPRGAALGRVLGVIAGLAFMAISISYLGFAVAGFITMIILLRAVERSSWVFSAVLAFVSVVVVVWLFGHVLGMTLPRGPWGW